MTVDENGERSRRGYEGCGVWLGEAGDGRQAGQAGDAVMSS